MELPYVEPAWLALATFAVAAVTCAITGTVAFLRGRSAWRAWKAATALVDVHLLALDAAAATAAARAARVSDASQRLLDSSERLGPDATELVRLLAEVPRQRMAMRRAAVDALLPTWGATRRVRERES